VFSEQVIRRPKRSTVDRLFAKFLDVCLPKFVTSFTRLFGCINKAEIDDLDIWALQLFRRLGQLLLQSLLQPFKLRPVRGKADAKQTDFEHGFLWMVQRIVSSRFGRFCQPIY